MTTNYLDEGYANERPTHDGLSLYDYFCQMAESMEPELHFRGGDVRAWQTQVRAVVNRSMGRLPEKVELRPQTVLRTEVDGMILERMVIRSEAHVAVPFVVLKPADAPNAQLPALICLHGHGPYGKESLIGSAQTKAQQAVIQQYNYDYAREFTRHGFITITPDLRNFGERGVADEFPGKDSCNVHFLRGLLFGVNLLARNVWDVERLVDYLELRPDVSLGRIGCVGFSLGGTTALLAAAVEPRIVATGIFSALSTYKEYAVRLGHFCGAQMLPGILPYADWPEVAGLIAPRPLYLSHRVDDPVFPVAVTNQAYHYLEGVYDAFNARQEVVFEQMAGGHQFAMGHAPEFFRTVLS